MYTLVVLSLCALACNASPYFATKGYAPAAYPAAPIAQIRNYAAPVAAPVVAAPVAYAAPVQQVYGPIDAAIHTRRTFEVRPVLSEQTIGQPQVIDISPNYEAVQIHFRTASTRLNAIQSHESQAGAVEHTASQDAPHRLVHDIQKPVIQEVREVIQPYRRITQEIRPVIEEVHTIVHKGERRIAPVVATPVVAAPVVAAPLPIKGYAPAYGPGAAIAGYRAADRKSVV